MTSTLRALRRHHVARLKAKWRLRQQARLHPVPLEAAARVIGIRARTSTPCSCPMCGNPRRHFGERAWQERRWWRAGADESE